MDDLATYRATIYSQLLKFTTYSSFSELVKVEILKSYSTDIKNVYTFL